MRKKLLILFFALCCVLFYSCVDEIVVDNPKKNGKIVVNSVPDSAQIFFMGTYTNKVTPDSITNLESGEYDLLLKKNGFIDTSLSVMVFEDLSTSVNVILKSLFISGNVFIQSEPDSAQIFLDGMNTDKVTPDTISKISPGDHQFTLKLAGYRDTTFTEKILKDQTLNKNIELIKIINRGSLVLQSNPSGAQIFLNNKNTGKITTDTLKSLETGDYEITLKLPDYHDTTFTATVLKDQIVTKNIELTKIIYRGNIFIQSQPQGAQIFLGNKNTGKVTPDTLNDLITGKYKLTLKLEDYLDTTFSASVEKNKLTLINIILVGKLPVEIDTLYYNFTIFAQTQFTFSFNQDITLSRVEIVEPDSTATSTFNFNDEFVQKGSTRTVNYSGVKSGAWRLSFYGNKVTGVKPSFIVRKSIVVP